MTNTLKNLKKSLYLIKFNPIEKKLNDGQFCEKQGCLGCEIAKHLVFSDKNFRISLNSFDNFLFHYFSDLYDYNANGVEYNVHTWNWEFLFSNNWDRYHPSLEHSIIRLEYFIECEGVIGTYGCDWDFVDGIFFKKSKFNL